MKTITTWKKNHEFEAEHDGNKIKIDGDKKHGHGPKALLLSGLAGCSGIDVVDILQKMRIVFSDFEIEAEAKHQEIACSIHLICGTPYPFETEGFRAAHNCARSGARAKRYAASAA